MLIQKTFSENENGYFIVIAKLVKDFNEYFWNIVRKCKSSHDLPITAVQKTMNQWDAPWPLIETWRKKTDIKINVK